ncbi:hypothetical protein LCGC14_2591040, partial [marine sediment metagenome]
QLDRPVDLMVSMNERTFAFIGGDIYEFYVGAYIGGSIKATINDFPNETKTYETLKINSNFPVDIKVTADLGSSTVTDWEKREDFYHADIPKSLISKSNRYGLGEVAGVAGYNIRVEGTLNGRVTVGDTLENTSGPIGTILSVSGNIMTLDGKDIPVIVGSFVMGSKNSTIEGDTIRGKTAVLDITFDPGKDHKLLTVSADIDKSFN